MATENNKDPMMAAVSTLMQLESMARAAGSLKSLEFLVVNETRKLVIYRQALLFKTGALSNDSHKLQVASSVAIVDKDAPATVWSEKLVSQVYRKSNKRDLIQIDSVNCPENYRDQWKDFSLPYVLLCPLNLPNGKHIGILWLAREKPWVENEFVLIRRLCETYAHAAFAVEDFEKLEKKTYHERVALFSVFFIIFSFFVIPIRISTLAPVEVVSKDPLIISSPMDGLIDEVLVPPNTLVQSGMTLFRYVDTELRNEFEIADKALAVSMAEFRQVSQGAFQDSTSNSRVSLIKSQVELRRTQRDYANELLQQVEMKAPVSGLLIYSDESDWAGTPVRVGERIMQIADPGRVELRIDLPVNDAIVLFPGAEITIFLDYDPLHSLEATLTHASYEAELTPENILAYRITADFTNSEDMPRIGLQGTAKIYGERITLFFYLFRRPIATLRQYIGL